MTINTYAEFEKLADGTVVALNGGRPAVVNTFPFSSPHNHRAKAMEVTGEQGRVKPVDDLPDRIGSHFPMEVLWTPIERTGGINVVTRDGHQHVFRDGVGWLKDPESIRSDLDVVDKDRHVISTFRGEFWTMAARMREEVSK